MSGLGFVDQARDPWRGIFATWRDLAVFIPNVLIFLADGPGHRPNGRGHAAPVAAAVSAQQREASLVALPVLEVSLLAAFLAFLILA